MVRAISNRNDPASIAGYEFTPKVATKMLPLVRQIMADLTKLSSSIAAQREQLHGIDLLPETSEDPNYREEVSDIRRSLEDDEQRLEKCMSELAALGVEAHLPFDGTVDFPAVLNRRTIRLCWHPDDEQVEFWHEVGEPKEKRQKIDPQKFGVESLN